MQKGIVKWFDNRRSCGFIVYDEEDGISVRFTTIEDDGFKLLDENQSVEFEITEGGHGLQAAHVKKIDD